MYRYIKIGGAPETELTYQDALEQNLLWYGEYGLLRHTQNDWPYVNIIDKRASWIDVLTSYIRDKGTVGNDPDEMQTIQQTTDGIFFDNAVSDMREFIYDSECGLSDPAQHCSSDAYLPSNYDDFTDNVDYIAYYQAVLDIVRGVRSNMGSWGSYIVNTYLGYQPEGLRGMELVGADRADGMMYEGFTLKTSGVKPHWPRTRVIQHLQDAAIIISQGGSVYAMNYFYLPSKCATSCDGLTTAAAEQLRVYSLATYLLISEPRAFLSLVALNAGDSYAQDFPEYDVDLGAPLSVPCVTVTGTTTTSGFCERDDGLLTRQFTSGLVVVNPNYWGDSYNPAEGSDIWYTLPTLSCPMGKTCGYEMAVLNGGGAIHTDTAASLNWSAMMTPGTSMYLPRTSGVVLRHVEQ